MGDNSLEIRKVFGDRVLVVTATPGCEQQAKTMVDGIVADDVFDAMSKITLPAATVYSEPVIEPKIS